MFSDSELAACKACTQEFKPRHGNQKYCKESCFKEARSAAAKQTRETDPTAYKEAKRKYYQRNSAEVIKKTREYAKNNPHIAQRSQIKYLVRAWAEPEEVEAIMALWDTRPTECEICSRPAGRKTLNIDHDHATNKFRGFLCTKCNQGLGLFSDNPNSLRKAANYLEMSRVQ